jgi:hypothetical protein
LVVQGVQLSRPQRPEDHCQSLLLGNRRLKVEDFIDIV